MYVKLTNPDVPKYVEDSRVFIRGKGAFKVPITPGLTAAIKNHLVKEITASEYEDAQNEEARFNTDQLFREEEEEKAVIRKKLDNMGVKYHPMLGLKKLRETLEESLKKTA